MPPRAIAGPKWPGTASRSHGGFALDPSAGGERAYGERMWTVLVILLVVWLVLAIVGFALKGLLWLGIIGIVLFVGTVIFGILRQRSRGRS